MKIGENWRCSRCGNFVKRIETGLDIVGFNIVKGMCPTCASADPELSGLIERLRNRAIRKNKGGERMQADALNVRSGVKEAEIESGGPARSEVSAMKSEGRGEVRAVSKSTSEIKSELLEEKRRLAQELLDAVRGRCHSRVELKMDLLKTVKEALDLI